MSMKYVFFYFSISKPVAEINVEGVLYFREKAIHTDSVVLHVTRLGDTTSPSCSLKQLVVAGQ